jgi:hypothetical protein
MTVNNDLFRAILAMDSYNRGTDTSAGAVGSDLWNGYSLAFGGTPGGNLMIGSALAGEA